MPRNGSGVYSLPTGTDNFVPGTTIESAKIDALSADFEQDANTDRPIVAGGTGASTAVGALDNLSTESSSIASATTTDLSGATGIHVSITGTTTITGFGTVQAGAIRVLTFADALTLTHNASSLILPGGANITTAAGDVAIMKSLGSGNWKYIAYTRADGTPIAGGGIANVVEDTTPQLGGNLDVNGKAINSPDGTDKITIPDGSINLQTNSTSRADITDSGLRLGGANARVTTILDEDAMGSDSATALATQQSIKAYVDANAGAGTTIGAVGAYAMLYEPVNNASTRNVGDTLAGSSLDYATIATNNNDPLSQGTSPSGTWQLVGEYSATSADNDKPVGLWQRVS